ncbi:MAG: ABC transporter ATP-binding protein [Bacteroidota bacterium]
MKKGKLFVQTEGLCIGYPGKILFEGLGVSLFGSELVCLMGPNGIGKSTLIKVLAGLTPPLSGTLTRTDSRKTEHQVSVVLTTRPANPDLTAEEIVLMGRYPHLGWFARPSEQDLEFVSSALRMTGCSDLSGRRAGTLSDGQCQMVMIARAIAQDTPVILLDEPTSHLDLNNRVEIMELLRRLCRDNNRSILVSTHELDLALQCADQLWLADPAGMIHCGIPEDLVLDGRIDQVFSLKGFSLKTGKMERKGLPVRSFLVSGSGHALLWTKNALERSGYGTDGGEHITIAENEDGITWTYSGKVYSGIGGLLEAIGG